MIKIALMADYKTVFESKQWLIDLTVFEAEGIFTSYQVLKKFSPTNTKSRILIQNESGDVYTV